MLVGTRRTVLVIDVISVLWILDLRCQPLTMYFGLWPCRGPGGPLLPIILPLHGPQGLPQVPSAGALPPDAAS